MGRSDRVLEPFEAENMSAIGQLFKEARDENHLSQREAARRAQTGSARISYMENGKVDVYVTTLMRLANAYGYNLNVSLVSDDYDEEAEFNAAVEQAVAARLKEMQDAEH